jgi:hypothetical protein
MQPLRYTMHKYQKYQAESKAQVVEYLPSKYQTSNRRGLGK